MIVVLSSCDIEWMRMNMYYIITIVIGRLGLIQEGVLRNMQLLARNSTKQHVYLLVHLRSAGQYADVGTKGMWLHPAQCE